MNYIRHLNAFFSCVKTDNRLTSSHVSLYLALFQYWNFNRFQNPFPVYRHDIMQLCKIGSKNTYHKCVKELHQAKYIMYHPPIQKYQPVKISMIRLDKQVPANPEQLNLFSTNIDTHTSIKSETQHVPNLTVTSTDNDTAPVSKMGHLIKHTNNKRERNTPTQKIFERNKKIQEGINRAAHVPKLVHMPTLSEVEIFFKEISHPASEAKKFFNHYKAIGWKIQGITPIEDWKALAEKWMANAAKWNDKEQAQAPAGNSTKDLQYLYDLFVEGNKIFHQITPDHFHQLKLELNESIMRQALQQRIDQVSGTNQNSLNQLWDAYLKGDETNKLIQQDKPILLSLAKRIAVLNHFHNLKNQSV